MSFNTEILIDICRQFKLIRWSWQEGQTVAWSFHVFLPFGLALQLHFTRADLHSGSWLSGCGHMVWNDTEFLLLLFILFIFRESDIWVEYNIVTTFHIFTCTYTCAFLLASLVLQASPMKWSVSNNSSQAILCYLPLPDVEGSGVPSIKNKVALGACFSYSMPR